jgi:hypothetical protein
VITVTLAIVGLFVFLTSWIEGWPWWIGPGLASPLAALLVLDALTGDAIFGDWADWADSGNGDGFGGFDGGFGDGGGGGDGGG